MPNARGLDMMTPDSSKHSHTGTDVNAHTNIIFRYVDLITWNG